MVAARWICKNGAPSQGTFWFANARRQNELHQWKSTSKHNASPNRYTNTHWPENEHRTRIPGMKAPFGSQTRLRTRWPRPQKWEREQTNDNHNDILTTLDIFENLVSSTDLGACKSYVQDFSGMPRPNYKHQHISNLKLTDGHRKRLSGSRAGRQNVNCFPDFWLSIFDASTPRPLW